ncbi:hypothetical protein ROLI_025280 [Roseobacter fucihabitans]|uniref:Uncharacterized protein n=1 Tax=Roseobacter fucihabitans TaxID=1537242 RepID=A0ABZ2BXG2_9RHOB|nr:hypothetical protein [Roseobacter litoralis]MBC6967984.1 hypothetical protein [Roseobacter litoralis]
MGWKGKVNPCLTVVFETAAAAALCAGMQIMAEAGVVPEEFRLKKDLRAARKAHAACETEAQRKEA